MLDPSYFANNITFKIGGGKTLFFEETSGMVAVHC